MNKFNMQEYFKSDCKDCWSFENEIRCRFCKNLDMFFPNSKALLFKLASQQKEIDILRSYMDSNSKLCADKELKK